MKRILCTGDSHTWGQGAAQLMEEFAPPAVAGDLRLASFRSGGYVNRLRRMVEQATGSRSWEWEARELATLAGVDYAPPCAMLKEATLTLPFTGALLRVEYALGDAPCEWELLVDGARRAGGGVPAAVAPNTYRLVHIHLEEGAHTLVVRALRGTLPLFRVECYAGEYAVLNGGIGSCPTHRLLEQYFDDHVVDVRPAIVLAEAHTINDWIADPSPRVHAERLEALLKAFRSLGAQVALMTVAPIGGDQRWQGGPPYGEYVDASRRVAACLGLPLCDANGEMHRRTEGMSAEEVSAFLLDDPWHPNDCGHAIYAELLMRTLREQGWLPG